MQYKKIITEWIIIEFYNNWLGEETVTVHGQVMSKKSSLLGTDHFFSYIEDGEEVSYVLTSKVDDNLSVYVDLRRNGILVQENISISYGKKPQQKQNSFKKSGLIKLKEFDIEGSLEDLQMALKMNANDPEIYFYLACGYSIQENAIKGFACLKKAVENNFQHSGIILIDDKLCYLRMQDEFENFANSNFLIYDEKKLIEHDAKK